MRFRVSWQPGCLNWLITVFTFENDVLIERNWTSIKLKAKPFAAQISTNVVVYLKKLTNSTTSNPTLTDTLKVFLRLCVGLWLLFGNLANNDGDAKN